MITKKVLISSALSAIILSLSVGNANSADIGKGKRVFNKCRACHSLKPGKNKIGPSLAGVFGRTAGTLPGYNYSSAMKKAGKNGLVWTEESLEEYLKSPRKHVKGTKMTFAGLRKESDRENLAAFLKQATAQK